MKKLICSLLLVVGFVGAAYAADDAAKPDAMAGYYGNTVIFTNAEGKVMFKIWYERDGTYREFQPTKVEDGHYVINNAQDNSIICQTIPRGTLCHDFKPSAFKKVGDTWTTTDGKSTSTHTLVAGHVQ